MQMLIVLQSRLLYAKTRKGVVTLPQEKRWAKWLDVAIWWVAFYCLFYLVDSAMLSFQHSLLFLPLFPIKLWLLTHSYQQFKRRLNRTVWAVVLLVLNLLALVCTVAFWGYLFVDSIPTRLPWD